MYREGGDSRRDRLSRWARADYPGPVAFPAVRRATVRRLNLDRRNRVAVIPAMSRPTSATQPYMGQRQGEGFPAGTASAVARLLPDFERVRLCRGNTPPQRCRGRVFAQNRLRQRWGVCFT